MILLDTNAVIWLDARHRRTKPLERLARRYVSPATLLELEVLVEARKIRLKSSIDDLVSDELWLVDEPPARGWFDEARSLPWTRDPFDRLIVAHALYRGWRLATADEQILDRLGPTRTVEL